MKKLKPITLDLDTKDLGIVLPKELKHLNEYSKYAKWLCEDVVGFKIDQFDKNGAPNLDWYSFRQYQIGSSEVATVMGLDEYGDKVKLFYSKLGEKFPFFNSRFTILGLHLESKISEIACYHDGTDEGWIENLFKGEVVRQKAEIPFYAINVNYPHLAVSLDYVMLGGQKSPFTGEVIPYDYPLEIKNISEMAYNKYDKTLPIRYLAQLQIQMLVLGCLTSEVAYMVAGNDFKMMPVDLDVEFCQNLLEQSHAFWKLVEEGREVYEGYHLLDEESKVEKDIAMSKVEPDPSGTDAFKEFFAAKYKVSRLESLRMGTSEEWDLAVESKQLNDVIKDTKKAKEIIDQKLKLASRNEEVIDFGDNGRIIHRRPEGGRASFRVNIKNWKDD